MAQLDLFPTHSSASARTRLITFPYAGGGTAVYHRWRPELDRCIDLLPLLLPGRETRLGQAPYGRLEDLVADIVEQLISLADCPYSFFGHSLGGRMAFEVVHELRRRGEALPQLLVVSACPAPHLPTGRTLGDLPDDEFLAEISGRYGQLSEAIVEDDLLRELALTNLRADVVLMENASYEEKMPLDVDVLVLGGNDDPVVGVSALQDWRRHTTARFALKRLPGGHFFPFESPSQRTTARLIAARILSQTDVHGSAQSGAGW